MQHPILDSLVANGTIRSYSFEAYDEDGNLGIGKFRNTERLTLTFIDGRVLKLDTFCSGSSEDTSILISE